MIESYFLFFKIDLSHFYSHFLDFVVCYNDLVVFVTQIFFIFHPIIFRFRHAF
jgi:hypothetical protein